mmetsp:Transcript_17283/g.20946  ORF Transcript_17283/g.20946 Transcript_17283/m.20946 type:complete len:403 (-) Transcript_17283:154-1362(-)
MHLKLKRLAMHRRNPFVLRYQCLSSLPKKVAKRRRDPQIPALVHTNPKEPLQRLAADSWLENGNTITATAAGRLLPGVFRLNCERDWLLYCMDDEAKIWKAKKRSWTTLCEPNSRQKEATLARQHKCDAFRAEDTEECRVAQMEVLQMVIQHMCERYPTLFSVVEDESGIQNVRALRSNGTLEEFCVDDYVNAPLLLAGKLAQEDFVIIRDRDNPRVESGSVCFSFSGLPKRFGQKLDDVHQNVHGYKSDLSKPVSRLFAKSISVGKPLWRTNLGIAWTGDLFTSPERYPFRLGIHKTPEEAKAAMLRLIDESSDGVAGCLYLKVEYQTLRRLEETPGDRVLFTIRTFIDPFSKLSHKSASQLAHNIRCASKGEFKKYLGIEDEDVRQKILAFLDARSMGKL